MANRDLVVHLIGDDESLRRAFTRSSASTRQFNREFSAATRGVAAGSGVFRSLGRSIVFASGGFLAFGGAAAFVRKTVDAAREAQVANAQLATQLAANGKVFAVYRDQIDKTVLRLSALAGIQNDELKAGLTTILRTVPDVTKALDDLALATDLAKARHISLASAASIVGKAEAGNLNLLRRQLPVFSKTATVEQALAAVRRAVAGQAAAGTTDQERFGAVLHDTEEIIGTALLPTLNKYLAAGSKWLQQMDQSGRLEHDVATAAHDFETAMSAAAATVKAIDKVTGSFENTLKILIGIKFASVVLGWAKALNLFAVAETRANQSAVVGRINAYTGAVKGTGAAAETSAKQVGGLRGQFAGLGLIQVAPIVIPIEIDFAKREHAFLDKFGRGGSVAKTVLDIATAGVSGNTITDIKDALLGKKPVKLEPKLEIDPKIVNQNQVAEFLKRAAKLVTGGDQLGPLKPSGSTGGAGGGLTATQRNTFFDNAIARILQRGGLGSISEQIAALQKANGLIKQRLAATKDVTRQLNLEDELLSNIAQIKDLQAQQAAEALQKRQDAFSELIANLQLGVTKAQATAGTKDDIAALTALEAGIRAEIKEFGKTADLAGQLFDVQQQLKQARIQRVSAQEFFTLGLGPTGDTRVPLKDTLRRQLGTLQEAIKGTVLDTAANENELKRIGKVLSEALVPPEVRSKIREMLADLQQQLKDHTNKFLPQLARTNQNALLAGLGLDAATLKKIKARLSQVGPDNRVPTTAASATGGGRGRGDVVVPITLTLDGDVVTRTVVKKDQQRKSRNPDQRRGLLPGGV